MVLTESINETNDIHAHAQHSCAIPLPFTDEAVTTTKMHGTSSSPWTVEIGGRAEPQYSKYVLLSVVLFGTRKSCTTETVQLIGGNSLDVRLRESIPTRMIRSGCPTYLT